MIAPQSSDDSSRGSSEVKSGTLVVASGIFWESALALTSTPSIVSVEDWPEVWRQYLEGVVLCRTGL